MKKYSSYSLILIGLWIRHLQNAENLTMKSIRNGYDIVIRELKNFRFNVSISGSVILSEFIESFKTIDDSEKFDKSNADKLSKIMLNLENIIFAEAVTKYHYITTERRYNHEFLIDSPSELFSQSVFESLTEICKYDFMESFKCLAYEVPTAAAFHMLRGTEGCLKELYFSYIKRNRMKNPMWNNMIIELKQKKRNSPPIVLLEALDNIRKSYRNPTNHPEAIYTISEAEDLMGLCIDVVNKIYNAIWRKA